LATALLEASSTDRYSEWCFRRYSEATGGWVLWLIPIKAYVMWCPCFQRQSTQN